MGLSGPRQKQRISADPRNLAWANDTNKFGFKMMEKMGWSAGKGLGVNEEGIKEHVKVKLKENNLGIGATKKSSDNWLGNTDAFSRMLAELNERVDSDNAKESKDNTESSSSSSEEEEEKEEEKGSKKKKSKKEKKDKKEKKSSKKEKKAAKKSSSDSDESEDKKNITAAINGRKASRHKYLRNKHAALQDSTRLNEILGIKSETASPTASGLSTPNLLDEPKSSADFYGSRQNSSVSSPNPNNADLDDDQAMARPSFGGVGGLGFAAGGNGGIGGGGLGLGSAGFTSSGIRGLGFVKATVSVMRSDVEISQETEIKVSAPVVKKDADSEKKSDKKEKKEKKENKEKKEKKENKEKKDKKDKKRKSASDEEEPSSSKSKKSKKSKSS